MTINICLRLILTESWRYIMIDLHQFGILWSPKRHEAETHVWVSCGRCFNAKMKCLSGLLIHGLCSTCKDWRIHHVMLCWRKTLFFCVHWTLFHQTQEYLRYLMKFFLHKSEEVTSQFGQTKFSAQMCLHIIRGKHENQVCEWTIQSSSQKLWKLWPLEHPCVMCLVHARGCANLQITPICCKWLRLQEHTFY